MEKFIKIYMMFLMFMSINSMIINMIPSQNKFIHPIMLMIILLILCLMSSLNIELFNNLNWISYLMFLIIVGGLMIIFLYFTSFISNMKMMIKLNYIMMFPIKMFLFVMFLYFMIKNYIYFFPWYHLNMELSKIFIHMDIKIFTMYMYMYNKNFFTIFSMIYLLIILTFIVKICINKKLTLRKIN